MAMEPFRRILVATDLSEGGDEAIREGHRRALAADAALAVCHAVPAMSPAGLGMEDFTVWRERADRALTRRVIGLTGRRYETLVHEGPPHEVVLRAAEGWRADLIIAGSPRGARRPIMSNVAQRIVQRATCSVLFVQPGPRSEHVVTCVSLSGSAEAKIAVGAAEAGLSGRLTVLHCIEAHAIPTTSVLPIGAILPIEVMRELRLAITERLAAVMKSSSVEGMIVLAEGVAAAEILRTCRELPAALVVIGEREPSSPTAVSPPLHLGRTAEAVIRRAPCSILVWRERSR